MSTATDTADRDLALMEQGAADRTRRLSRADDIIGSAEAEGRKLLAFGLALRSDIPVATARRLLADAPSGLDTAERINRWIEIVAPPPAGGQTAA